LYKPTAIGQRLSQCFSHAAGMKFSSTRFFHRQENDWPIPAILPLPVRGGLGMQRSRRVGTLKLVPIHRDQFQCAVMPAQSKSLPRLCGRSSAPCQKSRCVLCGLCVLCGSAFKFPFVLSGCSKIHVRLAYLFRAGHRRSKNRKSQILSHLHRAPAFRVTRHLSLVTHKNEYL
jgi:hypothetical protein